MPSVVERFATEAVSMAEKTGRDANSVIREKLAHLEEMVGGYDFATVISGTGKDMTPVMKTSKRRR